MCLPNRAREGSMHVFLGLTESFMAVMTSLLSLPMHFFQPTKELVFLMQRHEPIVGFTRRAWISPKEALCGSETVRRQPVL